MFLLTQLTGYSFWDHAMADAFVLALLVGPAIYLLFLKLIRRERELKREIVKRKEIEGALRISEKQLQSLSLLLLDCYEIERKRIARELHDELGSGLAVVKLRLTRIRKNIEIDPAKAKEECQSILDYVDKVIENIYRITKDMSPAIIEDLGLTAGIRSLVNDLSETRALDIKTQIIDLDSLFNQNDRTRQIMIYRILQECLTNVVKHSNARRVSIVVRRDNGQAVVIVEDDGRGFDVEEVRSKHPEARGFGLFNMDERVRLIGGSLDVKSKEGEGTRILLRIPLDRKEK